MSEEQLRHYLSDADPYFADEEEDTLEVEHQLEDDQEVDNLEVILNNHKEEEVIIKDNKEEGVITKDTKEEGVIIKDNKEEEATKEDNKEEKDTKEEDTKEEDTKEEDTKEENTKEENTKEEDTKEEEEDDDEDDSNSESDGEIEPFEEESDDDDNDTHSVFQNWYLNSSTLDPAVRFNENIEDIIRDKTYTFADLPRMPHLPLHLEELEDIHQDAVHIHSFSWGHTMKQRDLFGLLDNIHDLRLNLEAFINSIDHDKTKPITDLNEYLNKVYKVIVKASPSLVQDWEQSIIRQHPHHPLLTASEPLELLEDKLFVESVIIFLAAILHNKKILIEDPSFVNLSKRLAIDHDFLEYFSPLTIVQKLFFIKDVRVAFHFNSLIVPLFLGDSGDPQESFKEVKKEIEDLQGLDTPLWADEDEKAKVLLDDFVLAGDYLGEDVKEKFKKFLEDKYPSTDLIPMPESFTHLSDTTEGERTQLLNSKLEESYHSILSPQEQKVDEKTLEKALLSTRLAHPVQGGSNNDDGALPLDIKCLSCPQPQSTLSQLATLYATSTTQNQVNVFRTQVVAEYKDKEDITRAIIMDEIEKALSAQTISKDTATFLRKMMEIYNSLEMIPSAAPYVIQNFSSLLSLVSLPKSKQPSYVSASKPPLVVDDNLKLTTAIDYPSLLSQFKKTYLTFAEQVDVVKFLRSPNERSPTAQHAYDAFKQNQSVLVYLFANLGIQFPPNFVLMTREEKAFLFTNTVVPILKEFSLSENHHILEQAKKGNDTPRTRSLLAYSKLPPHKIDLFSGKGAMERRKVRQTLRPSMLIGENVHRDNVTFHDFDLYITKPWMIYGPHHKWVLKILDPNPKYEVFKGASHLNQTVFEPSQRFWNWYKHHLNQILFAHGVWSEHSFFSKFELWLLHVPTNTLVLSMDKARYTTEIEYLQKVIQPFEAETTYLNNDQLDGLSSLFNDKIEIVKAFMDHAKTTKQSIKAMVFQMFTVLEMGKLDPYIFNAVKTLPTIKFFEPVENLEVVVFTKVFDLLVDFKLTTPMYRTYMQSLFAIHTTSPNIFLSSYSNQYRNACDNFDKIEGPVVFYYINAKGTLSGAGFADLNLILNKKGKFPPQVESQIQALAIPEPSKRSDLFVTQLEVLRQLTPKAENPSEALLKACLKESENQILSATPGWESIGSDPALTKVLNDLDITTSPMRELAKEHLVIEVVKNFWDKVMGELDDLPQQWSKWPKFQKEFETAKTFTARKLVFEKHDLLKQLAVPDLTLPNLVDYLVMKQTKQTDTSLPKCTLCNRKYAMKSFISKPNGFEELWICHNEQCFQVLFAEDKIPPLSSQHINTGEIRSNIIKLFEPFPDSPSNDQILTFDIEVFSEAFVRAKATYIFQLYKRLVLDDQPEAKDDLSTRDELKTLFALQAFKDATKASFHPVTEVNFMELVKDLVAYDPSLTKEFLESKLGLEDRELLSLNLPIQLFHHLIAQGFKQWGHYPSSLPQELLNKRMALLPPLFEFFAITGDETLEVKVEKLFENEKFGEALQSVLVMPVFKKEEEYEM